jgi:MFS-type transporter involved in bile tolerance (Atg22 family)
MIIFAIVTTVFLGVLLYRVIRDKGFNFVKKELFLMLVHETALLINGIIVVTGGFKSENVEQTQLGKVITTILLWFVLLES